MTETRYTADVEGDVVVFLIGMRVNALWRVDRWLPVALAMPRMLRELRGEDRPGLLATRLTFGWRGVTMVQYWESFDALRAYAHDPDGEHHPAWMEYNREVADDDTVGVWHETYVVGEGDREAVYNNVPRAGLAAAGDVAAAEGTGRSAAGRLGVTDGDDAPIDPDGRTG
jgi:hypothetical protein